MKRILFFLLALIVVLPLAAQTSPSDVTRIYAEEQGNNVAFRVRNKTYPGTQTVALTLDNLQNCKASARTTVHEIRNNDETLLILRPADESTGVGYQYSYAVFPGRIDPKADTAFVYRMPCSPLGLVDVRYGVDVMDYAKNAKDLDRLGIYFLLEKGDTVYAARRGLVTEIKRVQRRDPDAANVIFTSHTTSVTVEHADGSFAWYTCLDGNDIFCREGEVVYPDTPLALAGSFDGAEYKVSLQFYWYTANSDKTFRKDVPYVPRPFFPPFATTDGAVVLTVGDTYSPVVDNELIMREMTKKEQKRFLSNKK